jgi:hypothetical protein
MPKPKKYGPIDTCYRCGSITAPLQIIFLNKGFEALCLECKKQHWHDEKQQNQPSNGPTDSTRTAGTGHLQGNRKNY